MLGCCNPSKGGLQTAAGDRDEGNWFEMIAKLTGQQTEVDGDDVVVMVVERENSPPALKANKEKTGGWVSGSDAARPPLPARPESRLSTHDGLDRVEGARQECSRFANSAEMVHSAHSEREGKSVWEQGNASFRPKDFRPQSSSSGQEKFTGEASESKPIHKYTPIFAATNNKPSFPVTASLAAESRYFINLHAHTCRMYTSV